MSHSFKLLALSFLTAHCGTQPAQSAAPGVERRSASAVNVDDTAPELPAEFRDAYFYFTGQPMGADFATLLASDSELFDSYATLLPGSRQAMLFSVATVYRVLFGRGPTVKEASMWIMASGKLSRLGVAQLHMMTPEYQNFARQNFPVSEDRTVHFAERLALLVLPWRVSIQGIKATLQASSEWERLVTETSAGLVDSSRFMRALHSQIKPEIDAFFGAPETAVNEDSAFGLQGVDTRSKPHSGNTMSPFPLTGTEALAPYMEIIQAQIDKRIADINAVANSDVQPFIYLETKPTSMIPIDSCGTDNQSSIGTTSGGAPNPRVVPYGADLTSAIIRQMPPSATCEEKYHDWQRVIAKTLQTACDEKPYLKSVAGACPSGEQAGQTHAKATPATAPMIGFMDMLQAMAGNPVMREAGDSTNSGVTFPYSGDQLSNLNANRGMMTGGLPLQDYMNHMGLTIVEPATELPPLGDAKICIRWVQKVESGTKVLVCEESALSGTSMATASDATARSDYDITPAPITEDHATADHGNLTHPAYPAYLTDGEWPDDCILPSYDADEPFTAICSKEQVSH